MDEMNNKNPFDEQDTRNDGTASGTPSYDQSRQDPYNQSQQNPYNQPQQNPYNQSQQNPYNQPQQNPYNQSQQNPYNQPQQNPYYQYQQGGTYNRQNIPQQGYVSPQYGTPYQPYALANQSTGMAVASLVLGIISICLSLFVWSFLPLYVIPIIGLILGIVFKSKHLPVGKGLSTAGIITSSIGLALPIILLIVLTVLLMNHSLDGFMSELVKQLKQADPELYEQYYEMFSKQFPEWFENALRFFIK